MGRHGFVDTQIWNLNGIPQRQKIQKIVSVLKKPQRCLMILYQRLLMVVIIRRLDGDSEL